VWSFLSAGKLINNVSLPIALKDIKELIKFGYFKKVGSYRGAYYILNENNKH